jgi:hypothetical protein
MRAARPAPLALLLSAMAGQGAAGQGGAPSGLPFALGAAPWDIAAAPSEPDPLSPGGARNPVGAADAAALAAYVARLRCADGRPPAHRPVGNVGIGVNGAMVGLHALSCAAAPGRVALYADARPFWRETRAPDGFTLAAD